MRLRSLLIVGVVILPAATTEAGVAPPACRMDGTLPPRVRAAAEAAWAQAIVGHDDQPRTIAINPTGPTAAFPIYFVRDRLAGGNACDPARPGLGDGSRRTFDEHTVLGICRYSRSGSMACSSDAIRELLDIEKRYGDQTSPSLVYVFAHEFGHRVGGDRGDFTEGVVSVKLRGDRSANLAALRRLCDADPDQIQAEDKADQFAFDVARRVFAAPPFRKERASAIQSVLANTDVVYKVSEVLNRWTRYYYGRPTRDPFLKTKEICSLVGSRGGEIILPQYRGSHPQGWTRLATIDQRLAGYAKEFVATNADAAKEIDLETIEMNHMLEEVQASGYTKFASEFCDRVARIENGSVDCSAAPDEPDALPVLHKLPDGTVEEASVTILDDPSPRAADEPRDADPSLEDLPPEARAFFAQLERVSKASERSAEADKKKQEVRPPKPFRSSLMLEDETFDQFLRRVEEIARQARTQKSGKPEPPLDPKAPPGSTLTREELNGIVMWILSERAQAKFHEERAARDGKAPQKTTTAQSEFSALRPIKGESFDQFVRRAEEVARRVRAEKSGKPEPPLDPNAPPGSTLTVEEIDALTKQLLSDMGAEAEKGEEPATPGPPRDASPDPARTTAPPSELSALRPLKEETFEQFLRRAEEVARRLREKKSGKPEPPLDPNAPPGSTLTIEELNELTMGLLSEKKPS